MCWWPRNPKDCSRLSKLKQDKSLPSIDTYKLYPYARILNYYDTYAEANAGCRDAEVQSELDSQILQCPRSSRGRKLKKKSRGDDFLETDPEPDDGDAPDGPSDIELHLSPKKSDASKQTFNGSKKDTVSRDAGPPPSSEQFDKRSSQQPGPPPKKVLKSTSPFKVAPLHSKGQPAKRTDVDNRDWTPTIFLNPDPDFAGWNDVEDPDDPEVQVPEIEVPQDTTGEGEARLVADEEPLCGHGQNSSGDTGSPHFCDKNTQTDVTGENMDMLDDELQRLQEEVRALQNQIKKLSIDESSFQSDDSKTKYFTGLPSYDHLISVFDFVSPFIKVSQKSPLIKFQHFILTLLKLRLNLDLKHLAYQFAISATFASNVFYSCLSVMYCRLKNFVRWPEREELRCRMPAAFVQVIGDRVTVIVDCFEIAIEKPANVLAQAECWSQYKHSYTMKYLIGIAPQGTVSFISEAWGGRTSDQYLTQNCSLLNNLKPNDLVLADRGFTVKEAVQFFQAQLKVPAYTKGVKQLCRRDPKIGFCSHHRAVKVHVRHLKPYYVRPRY